MKILIVEDDLEISKLLADFLQGNGYEVLCQYDGLHVLDCIQEHQIDLILLDIMLPYRSGDTILADIRKFSTVPVIVISAKETTQNKIDLLRLGADDYIVSIINIVAVRQSRFVTFRIRFISVRNRSAVLLLIGTCAFLPGLEVFVQIVGHQRYRRGICDLDVPALQVDIVLVAQIAAGRNILTAVRIAERYAFDLLHCRALCHDMALHHVHSQQNAYI